MSFRADRPALPSLPPPDQMTTSPPAIHSFPSLPGRTDAQLGRHPPEFPHEPRFAAAYRPKSADATVFLSAVAQHAPHSSTEFSPWLENLIRSVNSDSLTVIPKSTLASRTCAVEPNSIALERSLQGILLLRTQPTCGRATRENIGRRLWFFVSQSWPTNEEGPSLRSWSTLGDQSPRPRFLIYHPTSIDSQPSAGPA